jgi:amino acid transporter
MSRDGLLPKAFSRIHHRYKTPSFSTVVTGVIVAVPTLFMQSSLMVDLTSIGTLFAFILVSGGVLLLPRIIIDTRRGFRLPYINGKLIVPVLYALFVFFYRSRILKSASNIGADNLQDILFLLFVLEGFILSALTAIRNYSLIPVMGVLFCSYLLTEIPALSWMWFLGWMGIGLCIYFLYGYKNSKLKGTV